MSRVVEDNVGVIRTCWPVYYSWQELIPENTAPADVQYGMLAYCLFMYK